MENDNNYGNYGNMGQQPNDNGNFGWAVLGFFFPLIGLILYLVWKDEKPGDAKKAGMGALVGVLASIIIPAILFLLFGAAVFALVSKGQEVENKMIIDDDYNRYDGYVEDEAEEDYFDNESYTIEMDDSFGESDELPLDYDED